MAALTAGATHRPMLAMAIIHMQPTLQTQPIPTVLMALAGALVLAGVLVEDLAEADGGKS